MTSSIPTTQLAGKAEKDSPVEVQQIQVPQPGDDELLIQITATAINPIDWKMKDVPYYRAFLPEWPAILGSDAAGKVVSTGKNVSDFKAGDRVFYQGIIGKYTHSTFQQYGLIPSVLASHTPTSISDESAASISLGVMTPGVGFYSPNHASITPPWEDSEFGNKKAVVVLGGGTSIGQYAIQLARLSGFSKIVTSASPSHKEFLQKIGGENTVVLDRHEAKVEDYVQALDGLPIRTIFDSISDEDTQKLGVQVFQASLNPDSKFLDFDPKLIITGGPNDKAVALGETSSTKITISNVMAMGSAPHHRVVSEPLMKNLSKWLENEEFFPNRVQVVKGGLKGLSEALEMNKKGVSGVKVVVKPQETD